MKVSFIIPAYNEERLIEKCLSSVMRETQALGQEAEVIVADNGSTDRTLEIVRSFPAVRIVEETWKGANRARQAGLMASSGEFIASIDADTILTDGWLARGLKAFEEDSRLVALTGPFIYYDLSAAARLLVKIFYVGGYLTYLINGAMLQGGNILMRRDALMQVGGYHTSVEFYGDDTVLGTALSHVGTVRWTFSFPIYTAGRRLKYEGLLHVGYVYALNYFWVLCTGRPITIEYKDVRP